MALFEFPEGFPSGYYSNLNPMFPPIDRGADAVRDGAEMLHTDTLTWKRRPGKSRWSPVDIANTNGIYDFFNHIYSGSARVIVDREVEISEFTDVTEQSFYNKVAEQPASFVAVKDKLYFALQNTERSTEEQRKRIGAASTTKIWGIDSPTVAAVLNDHAGSGATVRIGFKYAYTWKDSTDGHMSSRSPISFSTGPANAGNKIFDINVQGTDISRVDKIDIFRTVDGGSTLYYLKTIDNTGLGTIPTTDSATDADLNKSLVAPSEDDNDPPPTIVNDAIYHVNRIWVIDGDGNVMFNPHPIDGKPINGVAEECFPPLNTFAYNAPIKLMSSSLGLLVFTQDGIHIITGTSKLDFDPSPLYEGVGISNRNAVCKDGDVFYLFSNTKQILRISDRVEVLGDPLSEQDLVTFDPATVRLTVFRKGTSTALYISNNNNVVLRFDINVGTWSTKWNHDGVVVSVGAMRALQTTLGNYNLLYAPRLIVNGFIWKEDDTTHLDDTEPYGGVLNWQFVLTEYGKMVGLHAIYTESSVLPTVEVRAQEITGAHETGLTVVGEPPELTATSSLISKKHYVASSPMIAMCRHFGLMLTFAAENDGAELYSMGVEYQE